MMILSGEDCMSISLLSSITLAARVKFLPVTSPNGDVRINGCTEQFMNTASVLKTGPKSIARFMEAQDQVGAWQLPKASQGSGVVVVIAGLHASCRIISCC